MLPLHIVSWSWQGKGVGYLSVVDLDADGRDEIVFCDDSGWWWAEWDGKPPIFQKIPIPTQAKGRSLSNIPNLPSNIFTAHPFPLPAPSSPSATPMGFALAGPSVPTATVAPPAPTPPPNTSRPIDIWLVTRAKEQWKVVSRQIHISTSQPEPRVSVGDWDRDGRANDVLFTVNDRAAEWWQRDEEGNIRFHARIKLPAKTFPKVLSPIAEGFSYRDGSDDVAWRLADIDGDGKFDKVDIDGDGKIDKVEVKIKRQSLKLTTMLSITLSSGCKFSLKFPDEMSFAVKDFDGDGRTEVFGWMSPSSDELHLYCWDFDAKARCLVTALREKVLYSYGLFLPGDIYALAFTRNKDGFQWLLVPALKGKQKVIARWRIENGKWRQMDDIPLPNQSVFGLLWVGDGLLALEGRHIGMASFVLISIEMWLREMIAEFFSELFDKHFSLTTIITFPFNLWGWKEGEGWRLLDHLTGEVHGYPDSLLLIPNIPPWVTHGDLDGDGREEIFFREPRSRWWIGQWKDGRWRKSRSIEGFTYPFCIIRDGKQRWLLGSGGAKRFIAVRIAE